VPAHYDALKSRLAEALSLSQTAGPASLLTREPELRRHNEMLLQTIWHQRLFRHTALATCSGKRLEVLSPGRWNKQSGPDFLDAQLLLDGQPLVGDVELHIVASDWERHHHHRDFEYNRVVLHVFLVGDDGLVHDHLHNGRAIERLDLSSALEADFESLSEAIGPEEFADPPTMEAGLCQHALATLDVAFVRELIQAAGRQRMEQKIARVRSWATSDCLDQALYQMLLTSLGHKQNRALFLLLARRLPINELKQCLVSLAPHNMAEALEAIFLHVGGLIRLPDAAANCTSAPLDTETQQYLEQLGRWWSVLAGYFLDRTLEPTKRWYSGIRPASFPERRLVGIAHVLIGIGFTNGLTENFAARIRLAAARRPRTAREWAREITALVALFLPEVSSYWSRRYVLGARPSVRAVQLIGAGCARHLVFNALLPSLFAFARERNDADMEEFLWSIYEHFPALESNAISRFMRHRILAQLPSGTLDWRYERNHQGLLHIFYDCCRGVPTSCLQCSLLATKEK
jgi:hypothetical protein